MKFECINNTSPNVEYWSGEITNIQIYNNYYEAFLVSRSSIYIVFGKTTRGGFLCAPDFELGCHLVSFNNKFWNKEKLVELFGIIDGITIFSALEKFFCHYILL